jgi:hypothetical protein
MDTVQKNSTTAKKATTSKKAIAPKKVETPKATDSKKAEEVKKETKVLIANFRPSAEERIKNAQKFQIITKKYDHLKEKKEELERFKISSDGTEEHIYFQNSEGYKLEVSNSNVIEKMLKLAEETLTGILNETEKQVQEFVI